MLVLPPRPGHLLTSLAIVENSAKLERWTPQPPARLGGAGRVRLPQGPVR